MTTIETLLVNENIPYYRFFYYLNEEGSKIPVGEKNNMSREAVEKKLSEQLASQEINFPSHLEKYRESSFLANTVFIKHLENLFVVDIDQSIDLNNIPEVLKQFPYVKGNTKGYHIYLKVKNCPDFSNQIKVLSFADGDFCKKNNMWEKRGKEVFNYNQKIPEVDFDDIKHIFNDRLSINTKKQKTKRTKSPKEKKSNKKIVEPEEEEESEEEDLSETTTLETTGEVDPYIISHLNNIDKQKYLFKDPMTWMKIIWSLRSAGDQYYQAAFDWSLEYNPEKIRATFDITWDQYQPNRIGIDHLFACSEKSSKNNFNRLVKEKKRKDEEEHAAMLIEEQERILQESDELLTFEQAVEKFESCVFVKGKFFYDYSKCENSNQKEGHFSVHNKKDAIDMIYSNLIYHKMEIKKGVPVLIPQTDFITKYMQSPNPKRINNIIFNPAKPSGCNLVEDYYNLWTPFECVKLEKEYEDEEEDKEALDRFLNLIGAICNDEKNIENWFLQWLSWLLLRPTEKKWMPCFISMLGCGKGTLLRYISALIGEKKMLETSNPLGSVFTRFNNLLESRYLIILNEVDASQLKTVDGMLKNYITDETLIIEEKNKTPYIIDNILHFIQFTNKIQAANVEEGERRKLIINCSPRLYHEKEFWEKIGNDIKNPRSVLTIYNYLKRIFDENFFKQNLPTTEYQQILLESQASYEQQFFNWLSDDKQIRYLESSDCNKKLEKRHWSKLIFEFQSDNRLELKMSHIKFRGNLLLYAKKLGLNDLFRNGRGSKTTFTEINIDSLLKNFHQ